MRKILLLVLGIFLLTGCSSVKTYDEISYKELNNMLNKKEDFILFIGSATCSACNNYKVTLNKVIEKYNVDIKYIDLSKLSEEDEGKLMAKFPISGTPTTVFIENGEENDTYNRINGSVKYSKIVDKLKKNKYIKD